MALLKSKRIAILSTLLVTQKKVTGGSVGQTRTERQKKVVIHGIRR
jgi:hypothetical protein